MSLLDTVERHAIFARQLDELCRQVGSEIKQGQPLPTPLADRCQFKGKLGEGSFGLVSKVLFEDDGKLYALKAIHIDDQEEVDAADQEIFHHSVMEHKNLCKMVSSQVRLHDEQAHILMELCEGGTLADEMLRLQEAGEKMPVDTIWSYLIQLVDGLHFMHDPATRDNPDVPGVLVHGDLKPKNIFFADVKKRNIKIGDFGLVRHLEGTMWDDYCGTPQYMAPELIFHKPSDEKVDIFALGCILFQMLNDGVHPFAGFDSAELTQVYHFEDPFELIESTGFEGDAVLVEFMRQMLSMKGVDSELCLPGEKTRVKCAREYSKKAAEIQRRCDAETAEKKALQLEIQNLKKSVQLQAARHAKALEAQVEENRRAWNEADRQRESKIYHRGRHGYYKWALECEERASARLVEERLRSPRQYPEGGDLFFGGPVRPAKRDNRFASPYAAARNVARQLQAEARSTYHSTDVSFQPRYYGGSRF